MNRVQTNAKPGSEGATTMTQTPAEITIEMTVIVIETVGGTKLDVMTDLGIVTHLGVIQMQSVVGSFESARTK